MSESVAAETSLSVETSSSIQNKGETTSFTNESYEELLAQGKRNLMCKEIPQALIELQLAARLVAEKFGETADECAEVYYYYGTALLEMARIENNVLGNALTGIPDETEEEGVNAENDTFVEPDNTTEEEKARISDEIIDAMVEQSSACQGDAKDVASSAAEAKESQQEECAPKVDESGDHKDSTGVAEKIKNQEVEPVAEVKVAEVKQATTAEEEKEATEEQKDDADEGVAEGEGDEDEAGDDTAEEAMDDDLENTSQEDVSNLQLAWEMLEIAKKIYKCNGSVEAKLKEADCWSRLGDIGLETEQYSQATSDYGECLRLLEEIVEPSSRRLASTRYNIGVACGYNNAFDDAISHYSAAIKIIEQKIAELQAVVAQVKSGEGIVRESDDPVELAKKELDDLQSLIPDIQLKINDAEEEKKDQGLKEVIRQSFKPNINGGEEGTPLAIFQGQSSASTASPSAAERQPVQNVSHLVRKKRKLEEEEPVESEIKKSKADEAVDETRPKENVVASIEPTDKTCIPMEETKTSTEAEITI